MTLWRILIVENLITTQTLQIPQMKMKGSPRSKYLSKVTEKSKIQTKKNEKVTTRRFLKQIQFCLCWHRDTVNQAMKGLDSLAPKLIDKTLKEVNKIAEARLRQIINEGGQQI